MRKIGSILRVKKTLKYVMIVTLTCTNFEVFYTYVNEDVWGISI